MKIPKDKIMDMLRDPDQPGDQSKADTAEQELPQDVDLENDKHKGMLEKFNIDPAKLMKKFAGDKFGF